MKDLINKIEDLKTEVNDHMDMDGGYKELIENELNGIKELVNNINYTPCCKSDSEQLFCYSCQAWTEHKDATEKSFRCIICGNMKAK